MNVDIDKIRYYSMNCEIASFIKFVSWNNNFFISKYLKDSGVETWGVNFHLNLPKNDYIPLLGLLGLFLSSAFTKWVYYIIVPSMTFLFKFHWIIIRTIPGLINAYLDCCHSSDGEARYVKLLPFRSLGWRCAECRIDYDRWRWAENLYQLLHSDIYSEAYEKIFKCIHCYRHNQGGHV